MNTDISQYIPSDFDDSSRVWIYQASRMLTLSEALALEPMLEAFTAEWNSHGKKVKGYANLLYGRFIVLMADETVEPVSGCSTDSSVRLIRQIEQAFHIQLFDRQTLAFIIKDKIEAIPLSQLEYALQNGFLTEDSLYFNNTVTNKAELLRNWISPLKDTWLKRYLVPQP